MARFLFVNAVATSLLSALVVNAICSSALQAAPRNTFPGRRIGGGTRGECAARPVVHLVPSSNVFSLGSSNLIAVLEGPSADPKPLELILRPASITDLSPREAPQKALVSTIAWCCSCANGLTPALGIVLPCGEDGWSMNSASLRHLLPQPHAAFARSRCETALIQHSWLCCSLLRIAVALLKQAFDFGDEVTIPGQKPSRCSAFELDHFQWFKPALHMDRAPGFLLSVFR